jgi:hypothetical protein
MIEIKAIKESIEQVNSGLDKADCFDVMYVVFTQDLPALLAAVKEARELIAEVQSQCPDENEWLEKAEAWLAKMGGE